MSKCRRADLGSGSANGGRPHSPRRRVGPCNGEGRRDGEANGDSAKLQSKRTTSHDREPQTEAITRTRVVRARSSATWDSPPIPALSGAKIAERLSQAEGAALTLSNNPQGLRHSTKVRCADARIEEWDSRGDHQTLTILRHLSLGDRNDSSPPPSTLAYRPSRARRSSARSTSASF